MLRTAGSSMTLDPAEGPVRNHLFSASGKTSAGTRARGDADRRRESGWL
jgi:hypothetical protein